ncbi:hypothetical protein [Streptomyces litchfieldiae]|uniref:Uncharacterized protein n=1 Tax=Streptomyces litchfieldiae TaxID=3075543 RepID=A0ABU2MLG4_9ACTN|nr:hypothetical protein [Streptomyces sp. DSM 44938]MDT0342316.1 hypothetical protein [Streptomyces sp. DSM 44938]
MDGHLRGLDRRPLICSVVAAGVLCLVWLLPSAYTNGDSDSGSGVIPVEQTVPDFDRNQ